MNNYNSCMEHKGKAYLTKLEEPCRCKYFWQKEETNMLFEVTFNFPIKHWWQKVVVEIVEC